MHLTFWQQMHRRYAHWRDGSYTYPDGTVEHRYERLAGIDVHRDTPRVRRMKLHEVRIREHGRERFAGAVFAGCSLIGLLMSDPPRDFWMVAAGVFGLMAGLYWMTKPFYPPPPAD